jgi:uncharacterized membrane protein
MLDPFLSGATCMGFFIVGLFFLRFWKTTRDRLFLFFALAFTLLLAERLIRIGFDLRSEWLPAVYGIRLVAYGLILAGIYDKNRGP